MPRAPPDLPVRRWPPPPPRRSPVRGPPARAVPCPDTTPSPRSAISSGAAPPFRPHRLSSGRHAGPRRRRLDSRAACDAANPPAARDACGRRAARKPLATRGRARRGRPARRVDEIGWPWPPAPLDLGGRPRHRERATDDVGVEAQLLDGADAVAVRRQRGGTCVRARRAPAPRSWRCGRLADARRPDEDIRRHANAWSPATRQPSSRGERLFDGARRRHATRTAGTPRATRAARS